ncbi:unnamed protein product [Penicillium glandicola]
MDGSRINPRNFKEIYTKACEAFTNKLQCQVFILMSSAPSPDMEEIPTRLEELGERVGEFGLRDDNRVRARWGSVPIKDICFSIKWELAVLRDELAGGTASPLMIADLLVEILEVLPF